MDRRLYFTHKCRFCSYMFVTERDLLVHEAAHDQPQFLCHACHEVFEDGAQLTAHSKLGCHSSLSDDPGGTKQRRVCKACGEVFDTVNDLYKHYVDKHLEQDDESAMAKRRCLASSPEVCSTCGASFSCLASLKVHVWKVHGGTTHQLMPIAVPNAANCSYNEADTGTLTAPVKNRRLAASRLSAADKPFKCLLCNWAFKYDFSLRKHMKIHEEKRRNLLKMLKAGELVSTIMNGQVTGSGCSIETTGVQTPLVSPKSSIVYWRVKQDSSKVDGGMCLQSSQLTGNVSHGTEDVSDESRAHSFGSSSEHGLKIPSGCEAMHGVEVQGHNGLQHCDIPTQMVSYVTESHGDPAASSSVYSVNSGLTSQDVDESDDDEPRHYVCKLCNFTCRYDFSYMAHLSQHDKLKELDIVDIQAHLIAANVCVDRAVPDVGESENGFVFEGLADPTNEFAIRMMTESGNVTYLQSSTQVTGAVNYILVRADGASNQPDNENGVQHEVISGFDYETCKKLEEVIFVESSPGNNVEQTLLSMSSIEVEDYATAGLEVRSDATAVGETYHVVSSHCGETSGRVEEDQFEHTVGQEVNSYSENNVAHLERTCRVVGGGSLNSKCIVGYDYDSVKLADADVVVEMMTCYFCNESFVCKSRLESHMVEMHVD